MSEIDILRQFHEKKIYPDDVIMAILSKLRAISIPKDPAIIHDAIFRLRQKDEFYELLSEFQFDNSGLVPFSEMLDRVLFRLETSSILGTLNPKYEFYDLPETRKAVLLDQAYYKFPIENQPIISMRNLKAWFIRELVVKERYLELKIQRGQTQRSDLFHLSIDFSICVCYNVTGNS